MSVIRWRSVRVSSPHTIRAHRRGSSSVTTTTGHVDERVRNLGVACTVRSGGQSVWGWKVGRWVSVLGTVALVGMVASACASTRSTTGLAVPRISGAASVASPALPAVGLATWTPLDVPPMPRSSPGSIATPCPTNLAEPSMTTGTFCGPDPARGSGHGPDGVCDGTESAPPCGPGVVLGKYYAFTLPGNCSIVRFDGSYWVSELVPPHAIQNMYVWMAVTSGGSAGFISPAGAVGFRHIAGASSSCPDL